MIQWSCFYRFCSRINVASSSRGLYIPISRHCCYLPSKIFKNWVSQRHFDKSVQEAQARSSGSEWKRSLVSQALKVQTILEEGWGSWGLNSSEVLLRGLRSGNLPLDAWIQQCFKITITATCLLAISPAPALLTLTSWWFWKQPISDCFSVLFPTSNRKRSSLTCRQARATQSWLLSPTIPCM